MKRVTYDYEDGYDIYIWPALNIYKNGDYKSVSVKFWKWSWIWSN